MLNRLIGLNMNNELNYEFEQNGVKYENDVYA